MAPSCAPPGNPSSQVGPRPARRHCPSCSVLHFVSREHPAGFPFGRCGDVRPPPHSAALPRGRRAGCRVPAAARARTVALPAGRGPGVVSAVLLSPGPPPSWMAPGTDTPSNETCSSENVLEGTRRVPRVPERTAQETFSVLAKPNPAEVQ